ncbi:unnamed protein product [Gadus morhua 'NCC']
MACRPAPTHHGFNVGTDPPHPWPLRRRRGQGPGVRHAAAPAALSDLGWNVFLSHSQPGVKTKPCDTDPQEDIKAGVMRCLTMCDVRRPRASSGGEGDDAPVQRGTFCQLHHLWLAHRVPTPLLHLII